MARKLPRLQRAPEDQHVGRSRPSERMEALEVAAVGGGIVAGRRPTHRGQIRLVHEFGCRNAAADRSGEIEQASRLVRRPHACGVARADAVRERRDDLRVDRRGELDHPSPLCVRKHAAISCRRRARHLVRFGKIRGVRPCPADA